MLISLANLAPSSGLSRPFALSLAPSSLDDAADGISGEIAVTGTVKATGGCYIVEGEIAYTLAFECDRCLKPAAREHKVAFREEFRRADSAEAAKSEDDDFPAWSFFDGDKINLLPAVREALIINRPLQNLCRDDCLGLCPKCGHDLNEGDCGCGRQSIDPRLAALGDYFENG